MNEDKTTENYTPSVKPEEPKRNIKKILLITVIVLLVMALGVVAYLYLNEKNTKKELSQKLSQLENVQSTTNDSAAKSEDAPVSDGGKISYVADVGAFSLNLPDNYRIVEYIDGAGEGGKATEIDVAIASNKGAATVDNFAYKKVTILATPEQNYGTFDSFIKSKVPEDSTFTKQENIKIAGVDAQVYDVPGLDVTTYYFFEKDGVHYVITNESSDKTKITDVINGFSFVY